MSLRNVFHAVGCMPMKMMLNKRKLKLFKICLRSNGVINVCARIRWIDNSLDICIKYDVHHEMAGERVLHSFRMYLFTLLKDVETL